MTTVGRDGRLLLVVRTARPPDFGRISLGNARNFAFWVVLLLLVLAIFNLFNPSSNGLQSNEVSYSEFVASVKDGNVRSVTLDGEQVRFRVADGDFVAIKPDDAEITSLLIDNNVPIQARPQEQSGFQTFLMSLSLIHI